MQLRVAPSGEVTVLVILTGQNNSASARVQYRTPHYHGHFQ